jgi:hypothetical protein
MRSSKLSIAIIMATAFGSVATHAQNSDDDLKVYAANVINIAPFKGSYSGYGIYLGQGLIITVAHIMGHWAPLSNPRILMAGQEFPATVIKKGAFDQVDLALLSVNDASLPMSLRLRRNPLCKAIPAVGASVVVVYPERTVRSRIVSPQFIAPVYRTKYNTLISEVQGSGSGAFDAERKCFLGIMSASIPISNYRGQSGRVEYFVPASQIADFIPAEYRF